MKELREPERDTLFEMVRLDLEEGGEVTYRVSGSGNVTIMALDTSRKFRLNVSEVFIKTWQTGDYIDLLERREADALFTLRPKAFTLYDRMGMPWIKRRFLEEKEALSTEVKSAVIGLIASIIGTLLLNLIWG